MSPTSLPDMNSVRRVLIIRGSAIGDVIHATPLSAVLKEAYPHLEITWIVEEICGDVVLGNPYLHEVIVTPRSRWKQGRLTSPRIWGEYLAIFAFPSRPPLRRDAGFTGLRQKRHTRPCRPRALSPGLVAAARRREPGQQGHSPTAESVHRVDWFLDVARALGAEPHNIHFPLHIPDAAREYITCPAARGWH